MGRLFDQGEMTAAKNAADAADQHVAYVRSQTNDATQHASATAAATGARARYTSMVAANTGADVTSGGSVGGALTRNAQ